MLRKAAYLFSAVFILVGILGFIPAARTHNGTDMPLLLGLFMVGAVHNGIHLASGIAAFFGAMASEQYAKLYFQIFGVVYALVTVVGFIQKNTVLGIIHVNLADNFLHLGLALATLSLGFLVKPAVAAKTKKA
jgi:hypothetical protein